MIKFLDTLEKEFEKIILKRKHLFDIDQNYDYDIEIYHYIKDLVTVAFTDRDVPLFYFLYSYRDNFKIMTHPWYGERLISKIEKYEKELSEMLTSTNFYDIVNL